MAMRRLTHRQGALPYIIAVSATACGRSAPPAEGPPPDSDLVPVAYGTMERKNVTGAVASVPVSDNLSGRYATLADMLQGQAPGVEVRRTASGVSVRIRGTGTLNGSTEPLYVIDGLPIFSAGGGGPSISPSDVARIEILKDAGALSLYGSRGANGVIVITTKRGR